ncbi:hypothetical protein Pcinc_012837 [Petrolisthes cinctipes]|uniref:Uncharacterized protein n=1 Tax=Petrolisthes cinctipes TaxID=88211 RepID=A0AAE1G058_PETCI|nr:hypothetical protein Pcinc_012837 [Petrolisthes cinctipes]
MVNGTVINSWMIHSGNTNASGGKPLKRRHFMQEVARAFIKPWIQKRLQTPSLSIAFRRLIKDVCKIRQDNMGNKPVNAMSHFPVAYCQKFTWQTAEA